MKSHECIKILSQNSPRIWISDLNSSSPIQHCELSENIPKLQLMFFIVLHAGKIRLRHDVTLANLCACMPHNSELSLTSHLDSLTNPNSDFCPKCSHPLIATLAYFTFYQASPKETECKLCSLGKLVVWEEKNDRIYAQNGADRGSYWTAEVRPIGKFCFFGNLSLTELSPVSFQRLLNWIY